MKLRICMIMLLLMTFVAPGCVFTNKPVSRVYEQSMPLDEWITENAAPYLIKELGQNPRFKNQPFMIVSLKGENVQPNIDGLTNQIREILVDHLMIEPGINLAWRPSVAPWKHHRKLTKIKCGSLEKEKFYIGIDTGISSIDGMLTIKLRALDLEENKWVTGFGIAWKGEAKGSKKEALHNSTPDDHLLGLRPLPFKSTQGDLLASYLARNLSCLFTRMETNEIVVHVERINPGNIEYFDNSFSVLQNYLAKFRKVTVTDDPNSANIRVTAKVHRVHSKLFQVWVTARYIKDQNYVPGTETEAYVALEQYSFSQPVEQERNQNTSTKSGSGFD